MTKKTKLFLVETSEGDVYALGSDSFGDDARDSVTEYLRDRFPGGSHPYIKHLVLVADSGLETGPSVKKLIT